MKLDFGRVQGTAAVRIDPERCRVCGACVAVCKGGPLYLQDGKVCVDQTRHFGCIACGHCMAVCPHDGISVEGRDFAPDDVLDLPPRERCATYEQLQALMLARRSVRSFLPREVEPEAIARIVSAATTAPMGIPPSEVHVAVFAGRARLGELRADLLEAMRAMKRFFSPVVLSLFRLFMSKESHAMMKSFILPIIETYDAKDRRGEDWFMYDAPLGMLFCGSPCADPTDAVIAVTYAMLAAESLGLGSCMLGFPAQVLKRNRKLMEKYRLPAKMTPGLFIVFGYPATKFRRALKRRFAQVEYFGPDGKP